MKGAAVLWALLLASCSGESAQPRLQSYGVLQPACLLLCRAEVDTSDIESAGGVSTSKATSETAGGVQ